MVSKYCIKIVLSFLLAMLIPSLLFAQNLGVQGPIYDIKEMDALQWIDKKLQAMQASGEIARLQERLKAKALASLEHPVPVKGLKPTETPRTFEKDLTVTLGSDIRDEKGNLIHPMGTRINPLSQKMCHKTLIFFDGEDSAQLQWALNQYQQKKVLTKLVLVKGSALEMMRTYDIPFYFDQAGRLIQYFNIEQIPAQVSQVQDKLHIREIKL